MRILAALAYALSCAWYSLASAQGTTFLSAEARRADFQVFCSFVAEDYAYFDIKATDWARVCEHFAPFAEKAPDRATFVRVLEQSIGELYDPHAHLGTNNFDSTRLVPSQVDVMALWSDGRALITDVRRGSAAETAGLRVGEEVVTINAVPAAQAAAEFEPRFVSRTDNAARDWALQVALAGRRSIDRINLEVKTPRGLRKVSYAPTFQPAAELLTFARTDGIGRIRVHNSLGNKSLVAEFDLALDKLLDLEALIIDLRDTPSGGTSSVARGLLGRFVTETLPYQRHELVGEYRSTGIRRVWVEYVAPRGKAFGGPIVVLVGRWTGSMGEGIATGLNATREAPVIGKRMAQLLGAIGESELPNSKIVVRIPVEKLFHVNGTPRELFMPCQAREQKDGGGALELDSDLNSAQAVARELIRMKSNHSIRSTAMGCV